MSVPSLLPLSVQEIPHLSNLINDIRSRTADILTQYIIPKEEILAGDYPKEQKESLIYELQQHVKNCGLWAPHLPKEYGGMGIGFLAHAYMNQIIAWSPFASQIFGVVAPNAGNESLLVQYGSEEQKKRWL